MFGTPPSDASDYRISTAANLIVDAHGELLGTSRMQRASRSAMMQDLSERQVLERSSAHHRSVAGGTKGPPFASHPRTIRRSPEGPRVPPLLRSPEGPRVPPFASSRLPEGRVPPLLRFLAPPVGRRRDQGSPLCFASSHHPSVAGGTKGPPFASHPRTTRRSVAGGTKGPPFASLPRTIRRSPEGPRVPPLLRFLAPSVGRRRDQGSPLCFASGVRCRTTVNTWAPFESWRTVNELLTVADDFGGRTHLRDDVGRRNVFSGRRLSKWARCRADGKTFGGPSPRGAAYL